MGTLTSFSNSLDALRCTFGFSASGSGAGTSASMSDDVAFRLLCETETFSTCSVTKLQGIVKKEKNIYTQTQV